MKKSDPRFVRAFDRGFLRSQFVSLFWGIITVRKQRDGLTLLALAGMLGKNKGEVSRWFSGDPNWTVNTIANLAHALGVELRVEAVERSTGIVFTASGPATFQVQSAGQTTSTTTGSFVEPIVLVKRNGALKRSQPEFANEAA